MNTKLTSLFAGIALLAGVGMANAEERLSAASMDDVTAAGGWKHHHMPTPTTPKNPDNTAVATADAYCKTTSCFTATDVDVKVTDHSASSSSFAYASNSTQP
jgi:hypothetical protein